MPAVPERIRRIAIRVTERGRFIKREIVMHGKT
jgi:hypothetical protein